MKIDIRKLNHNETYMVKNGFGIDILTRFYIIDESEDGFCANFEFFNTKYVIVITTKDIIEIENFTDFDYESIEDKCWVLEELDS